MSDFVHPIDGIVCKSSYNAVCSFCGHDSKKVKRMLVNGPTDGTHTAAICNYCVRDAVEVCVQFDIAAASGNPE